MKNVITKFVLSCLVLAFSLATVANIAWAGCWCRATSQESTQLENKAQLIKQLYEQVNMVANQKQMLEKLTSGMSSQLDGANTLIMGQFDKLLDAWKQAMALTHVMDDFEDKHKERHKEPERNTEIDAEAERRRRDEEWKKMIEAYLKGLNLSAQDLENAQKARQEIYSVLQSANGQVQAIQALGAMVNHTSMILERNAQVVSTQVKMFADNESDERAAKRDETQNIELGAKGMIDKEYDESRREKIDLSVF